MTHQSLHHPGATARCSSISINSLPRRSRELHRSDSPPQKRAASHFSHSLQTSSDCVIFGSSFFSDDAFQSEMPTEQVTINQTRKETHPVSKRKGKIESTSNGRQAVYWFEEKWNDTDPLI